MIAGSSFPLSYFLSGALMMAALIVSLFFLRYWKRSGDRLFLWFSIAFAMLSVQRMVLVVSAHVDEQRVATLYIIRLLAFLLILAAIIDKNRAANGSRSAAGNK